MSKQDWGCLAASTTFDVTSSKGTRALRGIDQGHPCCHLHLSGDRKHEAQALPRQPSPTAEGDPKFTRLSRQQKRKICKTRRRLALDKRRGRKGKTWLGDKFRENFTHTHTHYLTACLLKLFYTFQCGQNGKEHSDPVVILPAQRSWNNEALKVENKELEYKT